MNRDKPNGEAQSLPAEPMTSESEQITGKFAIDPVLLDYVVVDNVTGQTSDALVSVKHRIRVAVESAVDPPADGRRDGEPEDPDPETRLKIA